MPGILWDPPRLSSSPVGVPTLGASKELAWGVSGATGVMSGSAGFLVGMGPPSGSPSVSLGVGPSGVPARGECGLFGAIVQPPNSPNN